MLNRGLRARGLPCEVKDNYILFLFLASSFISFIYYNEHMTTKNRIIGTSSVKSLNKAIAAGQRKAGSKVRAQRSDAGKRRK